MLLRNKKRRCGVKCGVKCSKTYGVPKAALSRHEKNLNMYANEDTIFHGEVPCLGDGLEDELVSHCLALEELYFGLTMDGLRRLVFQIAKKHSNGESTRL